MTDAELLARHVDGDAAAFTELVRRHKDRLWSLALGLVGNPQDAEDALQVGLINAANRAASFQGKSAVYTWLHRIVTNACLDLLRRRVRQSESELIGDLVSDATSPAEVAERAELRVRVRQALNELGADQRAAIVLVDMFGYSVNDAAEILGVAPGTVKSRCSRGRQVLAEKLGGVTR